jgi:hypothetical protein
MMLLEQNPVTVKSRVGFFYTDASLLLSGMLVAHSLYGKLQRGKNINVFKKIAARYFRVIPPMAALIIFVTFILPQLSNGPLSNMTILTQAQICKQTGWRNLLLIHNWFNFEKVCMTHTYHVGMDFGLFLFAPFLVIAVFKHPRNASLAIFLLTAMSTAGRFYVAFSREITLYSLFGIE